MSHLFDDPYAAISVVFAFVLVLLLIGVVLETRWEVRSYRRMGSRLKKAFDRAFAHPVINRIREKLSRIKGHPLVIRRRLGNIQYSHPRKRLGLVLVPKSISCMLCKEVSEA